MNVQFQKKIRAILIFYLFDKNILTIGILLLGIGDFEQSSLKSLKNRIINEIQRLEIYLPQKFSKNLEYDLLFNLNLIFFLFKLYFFFKR